MRASLVRIASIVAAAGMSSGCVAAVIPIAAAGAIGGKKLAGNDRADRASRDAATAQSNVTPTPTPKQRTKRPAATASVPKGDAPDAVPAAPSVPANMQFLFGSGEAAALSIQAYAAMSDYISQRVDQRQVGDKLYSVVLNDGSTLSEPGLRECSPDQSLAIVLDVDETTVLNYGYEGYALQGHAFTPQSWSEWERTGGADVRPVPGVATMIQAARSKGVTVIFNTNRSSANAAATGKMLEDIGLGPAVHGKTLFTKDEGVTGKDARRALIQSRFCVIAMAGDQLGDFSDLFNAPGLSVTARRDAVESEGFAALWGRGWFMMPNPVYGPQIKGSYDEVFPAATRWSPPAAAPATP